MTPDTIRSSVVIAEYSRGGVRLKWFESEHISLHAASIATPDQIGWKLNVQPADRVMGIGTGRGGFAIDAVTNHGFDLTPSQFHKGCSSEHRRNSMKQTWNCWTTTIEIRTISSASLF
ncbi:MAG: hypothetical protein GY826_39140 [Fuerstiella sp.]|nr:hypothetical protein [Fuerstiella sp.]